MNIIRVQICAGFYSLVQRAAGSVGRSVAGSVAEDPDTLDSYCQAGGLLRTRTHQTLNLADVCMSIHCAVSHVMRPGQGDY